MILLSISGPHEDLDTAGNIIRARRMTGCPNNYDDTEDSTIIITILLYNAHSNT
jgi:hypothetical protein